MDVVVVRHVPSVVVVVEVAGLHIPFALVVVVKHRLYSPWHSLPTCQTLNMRNRYMDIACIAAVAAAVGIDIGTAVAAAVGIGIDTVGEFFSIQDPDG